MIRKFILFAIVAIIAFIANAGNAFAADSVLGNDFDPMFNVSGHETGVIWTGVNTGYLFIRDSVNNEFDWTKTVDGGLTFSTPETFLSLSVSYCAFNGDVFYDRWVPDLTTNYIHLYFYVKSTGGSCNVSGGSGVRYFRFDVDADDFDITASDGGDVCFSSCSPPTVSIARASNGYLYREIETSTGGGGGGNIVASTSTNDGTSWTTITDPPCSTTYLFPVRPNPTLLVNDDDITAYCQSDLHFYQYVRDTNSWASIYTYAPTNSYSSIRYQRVINPTTGAYYLMVYGRLNSPATYWIDFVTHDVNQYGLSTGFTVRHVLPSTSITHSSVDAATIFSAPEQNIYVFDRVQSGLEDSIVFYVSEDNGVTWSDATLFNSEEETRTQIYLSSALSARGGWIYPIWRNAANDTYDTDLLAKFAQLPTFNFPGEHPPEEVLQGFANYLGTWVFVIVVAGSIFFMHIAFKWPYEMMYPFGLICGAILAYPTVAIIEPWWLIAAVALIAALYIYRLILSPSTDSTGG